MQISSHKPTNKPSFKAGQFVNSTAELESNIVLSRAIIDMFGCDIPWVVMANNKQERIERTIRYSIVFFLAFLSPILTLPFSNRIAMKHFSKLTNSFLSNNHKAIHLENKFLVNKEKTKEGLLALTKMTEISPIEKVTSWITKKPVKKQVLDVEDLLKRSGGDWEKLRLKLINTKNGVLCSDFIFSGVSLGSVNFINNYLTEKRAGQKGFSAEFNMAEKNLVEKRADNYEKTKKWRYGGFTALALGISTLIPLASKKGLSAIAPSKFSDFIKKYARFTDYTKGIYMSRFALMMVTVMCHSGAIISSRNKTEAKDIAVRFGTADAVFYGGDLLLLALFTRLSDGLFKTKLLKETEGKKSLLRKIFPEYKSIHEVIKEVELGKLAKKNKYVAVGMFWLNMLLLALAMGLGIPSLMNKVIKKDVKKAVEKEKSAAITNAPVNQIFKKFELKNSIKE